MSNDYPKLDVVAIAGFSKVANPYLKALADAIAVFKPKCSLNSLYSSYLSAIAYLHLDNSTETLF